ncbi:MAG TPA: division/cell wall cluster transcriptional repressor MraZ, partial [Candidatus Omnitrophota bacterium]|nr:division/cell wall cluster transcriptional repressor MraZ [Candidatus Omnitrophota bacterium]
RHAIDRKGRLILPAHFREVSKKNGIENFFVTRGLDKCIFMFSEEEWRNQEQKFKNMPFTKQESRSFNRMFFSGAVQTIPDRQGRFLIPQYLKDFAGIVREVVIIGVSNRLEIWNDATWKEFYVNSSNSFEETAENILSI